MSADQTITFNDDVKLVISDVDETLADIYMPAEPEMVHQLNRLLNDGVRLMMVTGTGLKWVDRRVSQLLAPDVRQHLLISHCSGSEVWGYESNGELRDKPFFSIYDDAFDDDQKKRWREVVQQLMDEFHLRPHDPQPKLVFKQSIGDDPHDIMFDDRGPQITFEMINAYDMSDEQVAQLGREVPITHGQRDLRLAILERAEVLFQENDIPSTPRLGGVMAVDFAVKGVSKTTAVKYVLENESVLKTIGLSQEDINSPSYIEVWGDKFSTIRGGTDRHILEALPKEVRAIDFRDEDPAEFLPGYNTVLWNGTERLQRGTLEYLQSR